MYPEPPASSELPVILQGLREIATDYDAAFCDVWGVLHDGRHARTEAIDALRKFREGHRPVILLSNAPRPVSDVQRQFARLGVPDDCYDSILTSGVLAQEDLRRRSVRKEIKLLHLGPERDRGVFAGLPVRCVAADEAELILCTGLYDDETESPEDYRDFLAGLHRRQLTFLCVNPDIVVQRGGELVWCAGALARLYEKLGGSVTYYGKPYMPIYEAATAIAREAAQRDDLAIVVLGDGLETDIRGANAAGLDGVFIADGVHRENFDDMTPAAISRLCRESGVYVRAAMHSLVW